MASSQEITQIEAINSALTGLNTTINSTADGFLRIVKNIQDSENSIKNSVQTFELLSKAQKQTTENSSQIDALTKQVTASEQKLRDVLNPQTEEIIRNNLAINEVKKSIIDKVKEELAAVGSINALVAVNSRLEKELKSTNLTTKEGAKAAQELRIQIDANNKTIKENSSALTAQKINIGNYGSSIGELKGQLMSGEIGLKAFMQGIWGVTKAFFVLLFSPPFIVLAIVAIVGAFAALVSVFTSTASGGKFVKEIMAEISAMFDVVKQRAVILIEAFSALFHGDFATAGAKFKETVAGMGDQMKTAAKAAKELTDKQIELDKELAIHASEGAKEENQIQKLLFLAKDKSRSDAQRLADMKEAMRLSKEMAEKEEQYARRQYDIDVAKTVEQAKLSGVTEDHLKAFINLTTAEQMAALETDMQMKALYNTIGIDGIKALEEAQAKVIEANTKFFETNKRNQSQTSALVNEMAAERKKKIEDEIKAKIDSIEAENNEELSIIKKHHIDSKNSEAQYQSDLMEQNIAFLNKQSVVYLEGMSKFTEGSKEYEEQSKKYQETQMKIQDIQVGTNEKTKELLLKTGKELADISAEAIQDKYKRDISIENQRFEDVKAELSRQLIVKENLSKDEIEINKNIHAILIAEARAHAVKIGDINLKQLDEELKNKNKSYAEQLAIYKEELEKGLITQQQYNEKKKQIEEESNKTLVELRKKYGLAGNEQTLKAETDLFVEVARKAGMSTTEIEEGKLKIKQKYLQKQKDMEIKLATDIVNAAFSLNKMKLDKQLSDLETQKNAELDNANLTATQKANINKEYATKEAAIKTKQAQNEKIKSLFDIAINTAVATMKSLSQNPLPEGLPLMLMTIAMGAIQAGLVMAQPIPKFAKGTQNAPDYGIFGEAGRELMFLRSGEVTLADKPTYFEGSKFKGAQIFSNPETEKMIGSSVHSVEGQQINSDRILRSLNNMGINMGKGLSSVERAIKNKPVAIFDEKHRQIGIAQSTHQIIYLNRLIHRQND